MRMGDFGCDGDGAGDGEDSGSIAIGHTLVCLSITCKSRDWITRESNLITIQWPMLEM